jgi:catechol 2,3-dioxygenase-like lactoylglutathione lyase family enzyme
MVTAEPAHLHHLALGSADVGRLARFYRELFGLPELARHLDLEGELRSIWLDLGSAVLMLERTAEPERRVEGVGSGLFLLAFRVTREARAALERELEARGHAIESRTAYTSYSRDPDGNRIAISHYPDA